MGSIPCYPRQNFASDRINGDDFRKFGNISCKICVERSVYPQKLRLFDELWRRGRFPAMRVEISLRMALTATIFVKFALILYKIYVKK